MRRTRSSFNGAATLSSRMVYDNREFRFDMHELQWGRDVIVADGCRRTEARRRTDSFNGAATLSSRMDFHFVLGLQLI